MRHSSEFAPEIEGTDMVFVKNRNRSRPSAARRSQAEHLETDCVSS